jgi:uncharacterized protein YbbK (DUF523 family)
MREEEAARPRVGVSSCLLGDEVRFDGGHKRCRFLTDELVGYVDWAPFCPEVEIGLGGPPAAGTPTRCIARTAGSAGNSTGRGAMT